LTVGIRIESVTADNMTRAGVDRRESLAEEFEHHRSHLRGVAYRMLGSVSEADDAVQEAWVRLDRRDPGGSHDLRGWLRARRSRRVPSVSP
jgi:DNA-directed RNA polymerase specialized sigma24 family protein